MIHCECFCVCCDTQTFVLPDGATGQGLRCPWCGRRLEPQALQPFGEAEWLACDDPATLAACIQKSATERKCRLFACACCRNLWDRLAHPASRAAVEAAERFAEGLVAPAQLSFHRGAADTVVPGGTWADAPSLAVEAACEKPSVVRAVHRIAPRPSPSGPERAWLVPLLRDVFGNPFGPAHVDPAWLAWEGGTVRKLAEGIYQDRAFDRLPVLADALEEAGCADEQVLAHCRGGGPHVRGCWVLDLLLGRA
jgi:hypothetical protein